MGDEEDTEEALKRYLAKGKVIKIANRPRPKLPPIVMKTLYPDAAPKAEPKPRKQVVAPPKPPQAAEPQEPPTKYKQGDAIWVPDFARGVTRKATAINTQGLPKRRRVTVRMDDGTMAVVEERWTRKQHWKESSTCG